MSRYAVPAARGASAIARWCGPRRSRNCPAQTIIPRESFYPGAPAHFTAYGPVVPPDYQGSSWPCTPAPSTIRAIVVYRAPAGVVVFANWDHAAAARDHVEGVRRARRRPDRDWSVELKALHDSADARQAERRAGGHSGCAHAALAHLGLRRHLRGQRARRDDPVADRSHPSQSAFLTGGSSTGTSTRSRSGGTAGGSNGPHTFRIGPMGWSRVPRRTGCCSADSGGDVVAAILLAGLPSPAMVTRCRAA
jgi:hypothetical protein